MIRFAIEEIDRRSENKQFYRTIFEDEDADCRKESRHPDAERVPACDAGRQSRVNKISMVDGSTLE